MRYSHTAAIIAAVATCALAGLVPTAALALASAPANALAVPASEAAAPESQPTGRATYDRWLCPPISKKSERTSGIFGRSSTIK
jgi:hypothetical protein